MTTTLDLQDLVFAAILGPAVDSGQFATAAEDRVYRPGDWPSQGDQYPLIKLRVPREFRQSLGRAGVQFTTLGTIRAIGEVSELADVSNGGATAAEAALWQLKRQIEVAVINSYPLFRLVQQLASIEAQFAYSSDAETHLAGIQIDFTFEFYEGAEDFATLETEPLTEFDATDADHPGAGFTLTLPQ